MLRLALAVGSCVALFTMSALDADFASGHENALVRCRHGAVVCVSGPAADIGVEILKRGGNAVDSAVATAFALAVTYPEAGNIGGGGYMLVVPGDSNVEPVALDFRETAPGAATREMFVEPGGRTAHRRVGTPGTVRGLKLAHVRFGKLPWSQLVEPAARLARDGFKLDAAVAASLNDYLARRDKAAFAELHRVFGNPRGNPWQADDVLIQPDLAATLAAIAEQGSDGFYTGRVADQLVTEMQRGGGLITRQDLLNYRATERKPVRGTYRGYEIVSVPPSSSGGTTLLEMLNLLEAFDLKQHDRWSPAVSHLMIEAMKRAYRDRARYLGDPAEANIPAKLISKDYAQELAQGIDREQATPSIALAGDIPLRTESEQTTHLSVVDADRTAISLTYTLESSFGSGVVVPGAGFLLNDEMNDFNWLPGVTNLNGRIGTLSNQISPGKRMISSMTPTILLKDGKPVLVIGSPGGRTIINTVLGIVVNVVDFGMDIRSAIDAPRIHHQWLPDEVRVERALARGHPDLIDGLQKLGHRVVPRGSQGDAHGIWIDRTSGELVGAADTRISGKAAGY
jgi:gamma-glutamyltranspeptidase/glutathione hydrolase